MTRTRIFALKNKKKLAAAVALFAACGLLAGCDDGRHHHPPHHPPHEEHRGGHPPGNHNGHRPPPKDSRHHGHRRYAALAGSYAAFALNDTVMPKGTEISLRVVQGEDESLRLVDPTGKKYPIQFDAETGAGCVAGGSLSLRDDGNFVYKDACGGVWLVVRQ